MLHCTVYRTHKLGKALPNFRLGSGITGRVMLKGINHDGLRRAVRVLEIRAPDAGHFDSPLLPCLHEPQLMAFSSDRGMMVVGFEEINEQRYYQGWWLQWSVTTEPIDLPLSGR